MSEKETETVEVTLKLPKQIAEYIKAEYPTDNLEETLTKGIIEDSLSQLEGEDDTETTKALMKKYDLLPIFKKYGILPSYYRENHNKMSETETESKKDLDLQLIPVKIELCKPFYDFIEEYRRYFGSQYTVELICMQMIYSQVKRLFNELDSFARKKDSFLDKTDLFMKHMHLGLVSLDDPEDEE